MGAGQQAFSRNDDKVSSIHMHTQTRLSDSSSSWGFLPWCVSSQLHFYFTQEGLKMGFRLLTAICQEKTGKSSLFHENHPYSSQDWEHAPPWTETKTKCRVQAGRDDTNGCQQAKDTLVLCLPVLRNQTPMTFDVLFWFGFGFWCLSSNKKEGLGFSVFLGARFLSRSSLKCEIITTA